MPRNREAPAAPTRGSRSRLPVPPTILIPAALGGLLFTLPLVGLLLRVPWEALPELLLSRPVTEALRLSAVSSFASVALSLLLGVPLAWILCRISFPGRSVLRALVLLPMVLPPVVGGAALLFALGRRGIVGAPLFDLTGLVLPFSLGGVVLAGTFVSMPLMVLTVEGGLRGLDHRLEQSAETLGASRAVIFRRITLPLIAPSIVAGSILTWARALGEFGATLTFAGNLSGRTQTLPLAVFVALESDRPAALAVSLLMVAISLTVLLLLREHWWRTR